MNKDLPVFDITIADIEQGMFKISLVDKPAIEENFIYFSKEEQILFATDKEKREVIGPIMIPDKEIIRYSPDMGYYYVRFSEEIIKEIMYKYSKEGLFNAFGINHSYDTENYGYDLPNGTVFVKAKIESDELFTAIKDGEINGFSIEIKADIKPSNNIEENMNEFAFAKELGKMEAQFESSVSTLKEKVESLENENAVLLEAMTSFEDKFAGIEDLKGAIDMIQKHIESMSSPEEEILSDNEEVMEDTPEKSIAPVGDSAIEMEESKEEVVAEAIEETFNETKVEEEFSTEEEVNEKEVEEQFAAEQKAEDAPEVVEDKTVVFDSITPEKVDMINNFFNRK